MTSPLTELQALGQAFDARREQRTIADLTADERRVIRARHFGWECASLGLLALVFRVPVQAITAVLATGKECGACGAPDYRCDCPELIAAGVVPAREG